jgi:hypothetical protein
MEADLAAQIATGDLEAPVAELDCRCGRRLYRLGVELTGGFAVVSTSPAMIAAFWRGAGSADWCQ